MSNNIDDLGELYDAWAVRIFNYARTITRNRETAEDITHDVFLHAYKQAGRIVKMKKPGAYLMVMTRHHAYNLLKRVSRESVPLDEVHEASVMSPNEHLLFEDAFASLPAKQRETVYLHLICGFTYSEIAKMQNVHLITVKWRSGKAVFAKIKLQQKSAKNTAPRNW